MTAPRIRAAELAALLSGHPSVMVSANMPGIEALKPSGLAVWLLSRREGRVILQAEGSPAVGDGAKLVELNLPPPGTVALLAATEAEVTDLAAWWLAKSGQPAPLVLAEDVALALPALLGLVTAEMATVHARCVGLERSLAQTRIDYEETRIVIASVSRTLGHRPPAPLTLALSLEPSADQVGAAEGEDGHLFLRQPLGRKLEGLAAFAVHVGAISAATSGPLRLRIHGEESGRIAASWTVPMELLHEGWLVLDLPSPLGPDRETAVLEIAADVAGPHSIAFSLERNWVPAAAACTFADGSETGRALALRLWTARIGDRFVVPSHWNWDEAGSALPLDGVPQAVSPAEWRTARIAAGEWSGLGEPDTNPRLRLSGTATAVLVLPQVTMAGTDLLRLGWAMSGFAQPLSIAAWVLPPGYGFQGLQAMPPEASFSRWRQVDADSPGSLTMTLPVSLGLRAQIVLAVESLDPAAEASIEITELSLLPTRDPAELRRLRAAAPSPPVPATHAVAQFERLELHQHLVGGRGYQHLDLLVHGVEGGGYMWPRLRFKLALNGNRPHLEFRRVKGWPEVFVRWPGSDSDKFGPVMLIRPDDMPNLRRDLAHDQDAALMDTLLELLEAIVAQATQLAALAEDDQPRWLAAARDLRSWSPTETPGSSD